MTKYIIDEKTLKEFLTYEYEHLYHYIIYKYGEDVDMSEEISEEELNRRLSFYESVRVEENQNV